VSRRCGHARFIPAIQPSGRFACAVSNSFTILTILGPRHLRFSKSNRDQVGLGRWGQAGLGPLCVQNTTVPIPSWHEFLVFLIGVNLLWPVIRDEKGPVRYLAAMNWVINCRWVPLLWPWYQVAKAEKQCSGHLELAICPKSMFPDHKHPKPLCCPAGLGAQAKLFPR
jgi:hypothetical protein